MPAVGQPAEAPTPAEAFAAATHAAADPAGAVDPSQAAEPAETAEADPAPAGPPPTPEVAALLDQAWQGSRRLEARVERVRGAAASRGIRSLDGHARSLLLGAEPGGALERARAAVQLAPDLPDARFALARALWSEAGAPLDALSELRRAVAALPGHLEAWLWFESVGLEAVARAAFLAGLLFLLGAALACAPAAGRQLAAAWPGGLPGVSGVAWIAAAVVLPAALGEGLAGLALGAALLALAYGSSSLAVATVLAVALGWAGLHPLADRADAALRAAAADPIALAAWRSERAQASALDRQRLERRAGDHPLAARALALQARRDGRLDEADRRFAGLLRAEADAAVLHNAGNVRFALGRDSDAIRLYEQATARGPAATTYWNLSQAHGRSIQLDEQDAALRRAQELDPEIVHDLTEASTGAAPVTLDLPLGAARARESLQTGAPGSGAPAWRERFAPGLLGRAPVPGLALFAVGAVVALGLGAWLRRLPSASADEDLYSGIARVLQGREATDPSLRRAQLQALRSRRARHDRIALVLSLLLPGAAGALARRPFLGLLGAVGFAAALAAGLARTGAAFEPVSGGETGAFVFAVLGVLAAMLWIVSTALALWLKESP